MRFASWKAGVPIRKHARLALLRQGFLRVRAIKQQYRLYTQAGDFKLDELEVAVDTPDRNERIVAAYLKHCQGRQGLCFAVTVAHAEHLAVAFNAASIHAAVVCGETPAETRKHLLLAYEQGTIDILCNVGVLTEGYDHPKTACIIMARPTQSRILYMQSIGRGTRLAPGKKDCIILDITDNTLKHRLEPLSLSKAVEMLLRDGESILEAKEREKEEREVIAQNEKRERTTKVTKRTQDLEIQVLDRMDWQRKSNGVYFLEIGEQKHRILLFPSDTITGYYSVWAKLAPHFHAQQWLKESPLDDAMQHAEMKAKLIQADENKLVLVDSNAPWRARPVTYKQIYKLRRLGIPLYPTMTCGEASDLIEQAKATQEREKAAKKGTRSHNGREASA